MNRNDAVYRPFKLLARGDQFIELDINARFMKIGCVDTDGVERRVAIPEGPFKSHAVNAVSLEPFTWKGKQYGAGEVVRVEDNDAVIVAEPMSSCVMILTPEEAERISISRGVATTGFPHHCHDGKHYFAPMGEQPTGAERALIAGDTPQEAVERFMKEFLSAGEIRARNPNARLEFGFSSMQRRI